MPDPYDVRPVESFLGGKVELRPGDCREVIKALPDNSIDSVVTDPPYALVSIGKRLANTSIDSETDSHAKRAREGTEAYGRLAKGFMGKQWDNGETAFDSDFWVEVLRILKPGGHVVSFGGTRTYHRMVCAIEDAGFEIRDQLAWVYGSGFPKSHDVSKSITKRADPAKVREIKLWLAEQFDRSGKSRAQINRETGFIASDYLKTEAGNDAAGRATWHLLLPYGEKWAKLREVIGFDDRYDGEIEQFGIIAAQRPQPKANKDIYGKFSGVVTDYDLTDAARQWAGWGTALKPAWEPICLARKPLIGTVAENVLAHGTGALNIDGCRVGDESTLVRRPPGSLGRMNDDGWVPKEGFNGSESGRWPANLVHDGSDEVLAGFPDSKSSGGINTNGHDGEMRMGRTSGQGGNAGGLGDSGSAARFFYTSKAAADDRLGSKHPTVKPIDLMQWLCRLVTPKGGVVLDPFAGTGTTGEAAWREGFSAILIEREADSCDDIRMRLKLASEYARREAVARTKRQLRGAEGTPLFPWLEGRLL